MTSPPGPRSGAESESKEAAAVRARYIVS